MKMLLELPVHHRMTTTSCPAWPRGLQCPDSSPSDSSTASIQLTTDQGGPKMFDLNEGCSVYLYSEGVPLFETVWDLNCPDHSLELRQGVVYHNGNKVSAKRIQVVDASGEEISIKIK
jgi:predicted secreted protein